MIKLTTVLLLSSIFMFSVYRYNGSTVSAVTLAGAIIKAQSVEIQHKYKRKDCPVCKGKGWYISGDDITKVNCGYCEPDKTSSATPIRTHDCDENGCKTQVIKK